MNYFLAILSGYLIGSVSFGIIVTKLFKGIDIRDYGSGNTGFTNVMRIVGKGPSILVLIGDTLKGILGVVIGFYLGDTYCAVLGGLATMLGHTYPIFFQFRGGKGVATGLGVGLSLAPDVLLLALLIFLLVTRISRYVSLGSIIAALSVPLLMIIFAKELPVILFGVCGASFVIYRHKANIWRIYHGTENKIGASKND
jgi:glycerol-3-phosphate acyltransferase PlsY